MERRYIDRHMHLSITLARKIPRQLGERNAIRRHGKPRAMDQRNRHHGNLSTSFTFLDWLTLTKDIPPTRIAKEVTRRNWNHVW